MGQEMLTPRDIFVLHITSEISGTTAPLKVGHMQYSHSSCGIALPYVWQEPQYIDTMVLTFRVE